MNPAAIVPELQAALDGVPSLVSYWDAAGVHRHANVAFLDFFGLSRDAVRGRHLRDAVGTDWFGRLERPFAEGLTGFASGFEAVFAGRDGRCRAFVVRLVPDMHDGRVYGLALHAEDVGAAREAARQAAAVQQRFDDLLGALQSQAVCVLDADGELRGWSPGAEHCTGHRAGAVIGRHWRLLYRPADAAAEMPERDLAQAARDGRLVTELWQRRADGSSFWARISLNAVHDGERRLVGFDLVLCDLSRREELARLRAALAAERQAREASERASRAKGEFLAAMSHEIRTPMSAVLGFTQLALQRELPPAARPHVQGAQRAAQHLLGVLDGILDLSKVEAGEMQLEQLPFDLAEVLGRLMETAGVKAAARGLRFTLDLDPQLPQRLVGDAMRLGQVLLNLCDNAIKFTEQGEVVLGVQMLSRRDGRVQLVFRVADTGTGIDSHLQSMIFRKFTQADVSTARRHGGAGLGLPICQQLVSLMGGALAVQSQRGAGSTFHFDLGFDIAVDAPPPAADGPPASQPVVSGLLHPQPALQGARVLLVEDNEVNQLVAGEMLRRVGVEVLIASDGRQALDLLHARPDVDLVLMDCFMPVMDGFSATRAIRSQGRFQRLPVVALTANVLPDDLLKCRGVGMNDHVGKPFLAQDLYDILARWLSPRPAPERPLERPW